MTTNERRAAWREYACAADAAAFGSAGAKAYADAMLAAEDERFPADDATDLHAALATARAHALEQETRAANAEMALAALQEVAAARTQERDAADRDLCTVRLERDALRSQLQADSVPVAELRESLRYWEARGMELRDYSLERKNGIQECARDVERLCDDAEQRAAAAKPAEGGETGGA